MSETRAAEAELEELTGGGSNKTDEESAESPAGDLYKDMTAKDAVAAIKAAETVEDIAGKEAGESRVTVMRAYEAKMAELTEEEG